MTTETRLLFFSGSTRKDSLNRKLAAYALRLAQDKGYTAEPLDLADYPLPIYNGDLQTNEGIPDNAHRLKAAFQAHQGIFIAAPEYNASITPLLKNSLDWVSRIKDAGEQPLQVFKTRVFAICSASPSMHGGARGLVTTRQVLAVGLTALVLGDQLAVSRAHEAFDDAGQLKDEGMRKALGGVVERLGVMAAAARFQP
jgi:chromate reductase, NAD(P)H dehydrogenase (quinone)